MAKKVIVFDFDGTLVDSNQLKYDAFFDLFPGDNKAQSVVRDVLKEMLEETRQVILTNVFQRLSVAEQDIEKKVSEYACQYGERVLNLVKHCEEIEGATQLLEKLSENFTLFISSTTPEDALKQIVEFRGWSSYFKEIFGRPKRKYDSLKFIMNTENVTAEEIIVVGDGVSDRDSAAYIGCDFFEAGIENFTDKFGMYIKKSN